MGYLVTACICYRTKFYNLKLLARANNLSTVDEIAEMTGCSTGCGLCRRYIVTMLVTGQTEFGLTDVLVDEEISTCD